MSTLGDHFFEVALMWYTYAVSRSSLDVAAIAVVFQLTYVVVGPAAGVLSDRWDRLRTMIVADLVRGGILGVFVLITWRSGFSFPLALLAVFLMESAGRFFGPSRTAYLPTLVERDELITANGLMSGTRQATGLGGQALAGVVISTMGALAGFVIDAVSFVGSAVSLLLIRNQASLEPERPRSTDPAVKPRHRFWKEMREGVQVLAGVPVIRTLVLFATFVNAVFAMIEPAMPAYVRTELHAGAWAYGLVGSFQFGGGLLGGMLAGKVAARFRAGTLIVATTAFEGVAVVAAGVLHVVPVVLVLWASWGFSLSVMGAVEQSLNQALIPQQYLGRATGLISSVGMIFMPVGSLAGGFLANRIGAGPVYVVVGMGFIAGALAMLIHPTIRDAEIGPGASEAATG